MILEGIVTTLNEDQSVNIAPMGPIVDEDMRRFVLRPYRTSQTYQNLRRCGEGVLHVTDDVELLAQCAIGMPDPIPEMFDAPQISGKVIRNACRWYSFRVTSLDDRQERTEIHAHVVGSGVLREFFGFNRAKHAVLELAIVATRVRFLAGEDIAADIARYETIVDKTGGPAEQRAFRFLCGYIRNQMTSSASPADAR